MVVVVVANSSGGGGGKQWCMVVPGVKWAPNCLGCQKKPWVLNLSPAGARRLPRATYYINNCQFVSSLYNLMEIFRVGIVGTECWRMRVGGKRRSRGLSGHRQRTVHSAHQPVQLCQCAHTGHRQAAHPVQPCRCSDRGGSGSQL